MQFLKNLSIRARYVIFNILMALGGICAAVKILYDYFDGTQNMILNWSLGLAFFFFIVGFVFRLTLVKCPFCGDKLREHKKMPDKCPSCGKYCFESPAHQVPDTVEEHGDKEQ